MHINIINKEVVTMGVAAYGAFGFPLSLSQEEREILLKESQQQEFFDVRSKINSSRSEKTLKILSELEEIVFTETALEGKIVSEWWLYRSGNPDTKEICVELPIGQLALFLFMEHNGRFSSRKHHRCDGIGIPSHPGWVVVAKATTEYSSFSYDIANTPVFAMHKA